MIYVPSAKLTALTALALLVAALHTAEAESQPLGTEFTYQGQLKISGVPLNGTADFEIKLFDAASGGVQHGGTNPVNNVNVVDGLFTAPLNFGPGAFNGDQRWLEIAARTPAGSGNFTTLSPRQALTAAPYALYALTGPGSGGPWTVSGNDVFNTNTGNVGIGISSPGGKLDIQASNNSNVFFGRRTGGGLAHNLYIDSAGNGSMQLIDSTGTPRVEIANGLIYFNYGNVGIGTTTPAAKLDVRGDIRLGPSGQFRAASGEENLRIIRGTVSDSGVILRGGGFSVDHPSDGAYTINFTVPFASTPSVTATANRDGVITPSMVVMTDGTSTTAVNLIIRGSDEFWSNQSFSFIAIGPR